MNHSGVFSPFIYKGTSTKVTLHFKFKYAVRNIKTYVIMFVAAHERL